MSTTGFYDLARFLDRSDVLSSTWQRCTISESISESLSITWLDVPARFLGHDVLSMSSLGGTVSQSPSSPVYLLRHRFHQVFSLFMWLSAHYNKQGGFY